MTKTRPKFQTDAEAVAQVTDQERRQAFEELEESMLLMDFGSGKQRRQFAWDRAFAAGAASVGERNIEGGAYDRAMAEVDRLNAQANVAQAIVARCQGEIEQLVGALEQCVGFLGNLGYGKSPTVRTALTVLDKQPDPLDIHVRNHSHYDRDVRKGWREP